MLRIVTLTLLLLAPPLMADALECLSEGAVEQIAEHIPEGTIVYRDCYHCDKPAFEEIRVRSTEIRPCHMTGSEGERALYVTGQVLRRFQMPQCSEIEDVQKSKTQLKAELLVLNYAWLRNDKKARAENIADSFAENSHHRCKTFSDKALQPKKTKKTKRK